MTKTARRPATAAGAVCFTVGGRLQARWRLRVRSTDLGPDWYVVEQCAYVDTTPEGLITRIDLLCSGFCPELSDG